MDSDIISVGIDIGTSTTQVIFSKLTMANSTGYFAIPRISISKKEVIYKSDIYITPLIDSTMIDGDAIKKIVSDEFAKAGMAVGSTDTGAVIITGESARKENAAMVLEKLSGFSGDFVVATAGPDLESVIAGKGSGAQQYSEENATTVINFDIGGGTTNIVVFDCGEVIAKGCYDIGGRQIRVSDDYRIEYVSPSAEKIAASLGIEIRQGMRSNKDDIKAVCDKMAELLGQAAGLAEPESLLESVKTAGSTDLKLKKPVRCVCFSGGVADCVYKTNYDPFEFGDIGVILGGAIRSSSLMSRLKVVHSQETIRATVVGAGTYTTTISGSTIAYTNGIFPIKNVPVFKLSEDEEERCFAGDSGFLEERARWFMKQNDTGRFVLAVKGKPNPDYEQVKLLSQCISKALCSVLSTSEPLIVLVEYDMAKALGQLIKPQIGDRSLISIDSVKVEPTDYLDLGKPMMDGLVIPVVVKTLIFG
ncbi:MAG: ethanolamine ammonia-lyase reactivating factor EutA [Clostridiales bacterium]|nr:ethanolamine ammonia-lyase reactivating factor EutA [Clostridiales bacterium]